MAGTTRPWRSKSTYQSQAAGASNATRELRSAGGVRRTSAWRNGSIRSKRAYCARSPRWPWFWLLAPCSRPHRPCPHRCAAVAKRRFVLLRAKRASTGRRYRPAWPIAGCAGRRAWSPAVGTAAHKNIAGFSSNKTAPLPPAPGLYEFLIPPRVQSKWTVTKP